MIMIYGLDADLIMLSMASGVNNIYLLREKQNMDNILLMWMGMNFCILILIC